MAVPNPHRVRRRAVLVVLLAAGLATAGALTAQSASASSASGIDLDIEISGPSPEPTPARSAESGPDGGGAGSPGAVIIDEVVPPLEADEALGGDVFALSGILMLSGLEGSITTSVDPQGGDATLRFTVQSAATVPVDFDVDFQLDNSLGSRVAEVRRTDLAPLSPGETRMIEAVLPDVGQWALYSARVIFTPPAEVDGVSLAPITRDTAIAVAPVFSLIAGAGVGAVALVALAFGPGAPSVAAALGSVNGRVMKLFGR